MKKYFYWGAIGLILFEIANVYFIMPMPGSQQMETIGLAYFLYSWRWVLRGLFALLMLAGLVKAFKASKIFPVIFLLLVFFVVYAANFKMAADSMFLQPKQLVMKTAAANTVDSNKLVLGIEYNGEARAYPIQFIGYHHQVSDSIGGKPVIVTYCTVCRTGRVYEPVVNGQPETFRLVGMDHFNAMFEDKRTKSWWRQVNGQAIAGKLKGQSLPEMASSQMSLGQWLVLHPNSLVMQPDPAFNKIYTGMAAYEEGKSKSGLTKRDTLSWLPKSWVIGIDMGKESKAYDWNSLQAQQIIHDELNNQPIMLVLAADNKSFVALKRNSRDEKFHLEGDSLTNGQQRYSFTGKATNGSKDLERINAYQEYWHSWQTFHPGTKK